MGTTTTTLLTFEEFERLPDEPGKSELLDGEPIQLPPAMLQHMEIAERLFLLLLRFIEANGVPANLGKVHMEFGYKLGGRIWLVPDVSITHPGQLRGKYLEGAPAVAIEVISSSDRADRMERKLKMYFDHGVLEVWVIYPDTHMVAIHSVGRVREEHQILSSDLLPEFSLHLSQLFG